MTKNKGQDRLDQLTSPKFSADAGSRFRMIRMKMLVDQAEIGELLGISQQQVSKLEKGHLEHVGFSTARFKAVFGKWYTFVLFGTDFPELNPAHIHQKYWDTRLRIQRKPGSGL